MHMADALISPAVGGTMWAATVGLTASSARRLKKDLDERRVPLMGVLGAFVFAAQMINFSIPGTGSSGHLGGGTILAILLGPHAAFITLASVLTIQALFFADGGLLALGCNIFNLGFFPCFIAYPLIYRRIAGEAPTRRRMAVAAIVSAVVGLQLGAFSVVLETVFSGISALPFGAFVLLMLPVHLAIGVVEGLATAAVISFVAAARPEVLAAHAGAATAPRRMRGVLIGFSVAAVLIGGLVSWFASTHPDGLEWAMFRTSGREELEAPAGGLHESLAAVQRRTALLPDYDFPPAQDESAGRATGPATAPTAEPEPVWPAVRAGTSVAGLVGAVLTLALALLIGVGLRFIRRRA